MEKFLAKLHKKPEHHKKRFALLASATITLFIFGFWSIATFGVSGGGTIAGNSGSQVASVSAASGEGEVSPFQSLRMSIGGSLEALVKSFGELKDGFNSVNFESEYTNMRDSALESYGQ